MEILINTDNNISGTAEMIAYFKTSIAEDFERFSEHLTRMEVKLSDENGDKSTGNDKKCVMEARIKGMQPTVVTSHSTTVEKAVKEASDKLKTSLDTVMGRLRNH
ncbi:HPF/RaiA family ribosome-associated protein [Kaistella sp. G5-32]|uniref:HPF/RaiA family ribosome-associated protein n=1 Tax=Kaistella gelatinilytica TaxID=2787636 RepID=A0ABS0FAZ6_9FLAO|nr:HPF/RaiA family ribosome-associated protein [Kaistella gelatinilytica]MBF8456888.1 HPF/RaiA family ribosome-associated protein [Kaistella gelatinilytica]